MTALPPVNPSLRGAPYTWTEAASDAVPVDHGIYVWGDGSMVHATPSGAVRLTTARISGTAATRDAQAYGSFGAAPEGPRELTR